MKFIKKPLFWYILFFTAMVGLFLAYPLIVDEWIFEYLLKNRDLSGKHASIIYKTMELVPLAYIILLGLMVAIINTVVYGFLDINIKKAGFTKSIGFLCLLGLLAVSYFLHNHINEMLKQISNNDLEKLSIAYYNFSKFITICTFIFFAFFAVLDGLYGYVKTFAENKLERKISQLQLWLIDVPVLISCICIIFFCENFKTVLISPEIGGYRLFTNIFGAGAWGLQLIFSQTIFLVLMIMQFFWEKDEKRKLALETSVQS